MRIGKRVKVKERIKVGDVEGRESRGRGRGEEGRRGTQYMNNNESGTHQGGGEPITSLNTLFFPIIKHDINSKKKKRMTKMH